MTSASKTLKARSLPFFLVGEKGFEVNSDVAVGTARDLCLERTLALVDWRRGFGGVCGGWYDEEGLLDDPEDVCELVLLLSFL